MIDTHAHLSFPQFDKDRTQVIRRAREEGVKAIINPGTDLGQSRAAVTLAEEEQNVYAAVGVHPHESTSAAEGILKQFKELVVHPRTFAIGEVGLERTERVPDLDTQKTTLRWFINCAQEHRKPIIFHVRNAHKEFRAFLEECEPVQGVMHCFSGTCDDADYYLAKGLYISVTGIVTFPNADKLRNIVRHVPLERLLLETDAPFLAPQSQRGKRGEPAFVREIALKIAEVKGVSLGEVERVTDRNAQELFGFP